MNDIEPMIVGLGVCCEDRIGLAPRWPKPDAGVHLRTVLRQCGGMAATSMAAASALGIPTALISMVGDDESGCWLKSQMEEQGVDCSQFVLRPEFPTPYSTIIVHEKSGQRRIFHYRPRNFDLSPSEIDFSPITSARFLHLDGHHLEVAIHAAQFARKNRVRVCLDASFPYPGLEELLPWVDYMICNRHFPQQFTGKKTMKAALRSLAKYGAKMVAATLGSEGVLWIKKDEFFTLPAFDVQVVDTTGAGDVFHGAFLAGLCRKKSLAEAIRYASATASLSCTALGGQGKLPEHKEVVGFLRKQS